ncbi:MAG: FMN-binding protein [candidate division WOR-3 bacterium]
MMPISQFYIDSLHLMEKYLKCCERVDTVDVRVDKGINDSLRRWGHPPFSRKVLRFYRGYKGGELYTTLVIDDIKGKHMPITYMVVLDDKGKVKAVEILIYREKYGWEIKEKTFLKQFEGKGKEDDLAHGKVIRNIPGATISVKSITAGVKRILFLYDMVFGK